MSHKPKCLSLDSFIGGVITSIVVSWLVIIAIVFSSPAEPHEVAPEDNWIAQGGLRNAAGQLCCGQNDCGRKVAGEVREIVGGYKVDAIFEITGWSGARRIEVHETVPYAEALPSPDGSYWRCAWAGERKCFFSPPGSS